MKVYKHVEDEKAVKNIVERGLIKFTKITELNDPTELFPAFYEEEVKKSLQFFRENGYSDEEFEKVKMQYNFMKQVSLPHLIFPVSSKEDANNRIRNFDYDNTEQLQKLFTAVVDKIKDRCGVFSVTKRNDSLPMWAHYSNNAEGFLIEFTDLDELFHGDETGILNLLEDVNYTEKRSGVTFEGDSYKSIFFEKNIDWKYEREMRVVQSLSDCQEEKLIANGEEFSIFLQKIDKKYITRVIFGWKTPEDTVNRLKEELKEIDSSLEFSVANIDEGKIKIL